MTEQWLPVVGYEGYYEVSDQGRVRSLDRIIGGSRGPRRWKGRLLKQVKDGRYLVVDVCRDGVRSKQSVHAIVLTAFRGDCPPGKEACHWNADGTENRLSNLRWGTKKENGEDKARTGCNGYRGENFHSAKLTAQDVLTIDRRLRQGESCSVLAQEFGVIYESIWKIRRGKTRRHITGRNQPT